MTARGAGLLPCQVGQVAGWGASALSVPVPRLSAKGEQGKERIYGIDWIVIKTWLCRPPFLILRIP